MVNLPSEEQMNNVKVMNRYIIDGQEYEKEGDDNKGLWIMKNIKTGAIRRIESNAILSIKRFESVNDLDENTVSVRNISQKIVNKF